MDYILDTNVVVLLIRNRKFEDYFKNNINLPTNRILISTVVEGELESLALQWNWGIQKRNKLKILLNRFLVHPIRIQKVVTLYGEIDAYSQGKLKARRLPKGLSARNMGKNDLWISSTASMTGATLLTTDKDFQHLDGVYLTLELLDIRLFA